MNDPAAATDDRAVVVPEDQAAGLVDAQPEADVELAHLAALMIRRHPKLAMEENAPIDHPGEFVLDHVPKWLRSPGHRREAPIRLRYPPVVMLLRRSGPGAPDQL